MSEDDKFLDSIFCLTNHIIYLHPNLFLVRVHHDLIVPEMNIIRKKY